MAMTLDDDHWPSLAPIRTSSTPTASCPPIIICRSPILQENCCTQLQQPAHDENEAACSCKTASMSSMKTLPGTVISTPAQAGAAPCCNTCSSSLRHPDPDHSSGTAHLVRRSSSTRKKSYAHLASCFSLSKPTSSPCRHRLCMPTCMPKKGPFLQSMASLFPSGGSFQSFYSSPTGKAVQLSGAFPRSLSTGKYIASPRTPSANPSMSGKLQHFASPWTPGSGSNLHSLSSPRTPSSSKAQNFFVAIPSPRTPFASGAASLSFARRRKLSLFMPPNGTVDKKKAADHVDEPTSPQVTCMGRVRRQSHCRKPHLNDVVNPHARKHNTAAQRKEAHSKKAAGLSKSHRISSNDAVSRLSSLEACKQKLGKSQLQSLHKTIGNIGNECDIASESDQQDQQGAPNGKIKEFMYLDYARQCSSNSVEGIDGNLRTSTMQKADVGMPEKPSRHTVSDGSAESTEYDNLELSTDTPSTLHTISGQIPLDLQEEAHKPPIDRCLLLIRSNSSRKVSDFNPNSPPIMF